MSTSLPKAVVAAAVAAAAATLTLAAAGPAAADLADGNPDITFSPRPGGITATVQSWTPEPTNCTYNADGIRRDFFLPGHDDNTAKLGQARAVLEFPGVPLFREWNVDVNCVNGKSKSMTYWY